MHLARGSHVKPKIVKARLIGIPRKHPLMRTLSGSCGKCFVNCLYFLVFSDSCSDAS